MANQSNVKEVAQLKIHIVFVSIIALFGILSLGGGSVYIASGQNVTTTNDPDASFGFCGSSYPATPWRQ